MKLVSVKRVYLGILLTIFIGIVFHAPLSVWLGSIFPSYELLIKSWKEILMLIATPLAVFLVTKHKLWSELWRDWLFRAIIAFAILHVITVAILWNGLQPTLAGLSIDLRWLLYFSLVYVAVRLYPTSRQLFLKLGIASALVVGVFALLQIFILPPDALALIGYDKDTTIAPYLTVDQNPEYIRISSTLRGPNPLGAYAVIVLGIVMAACIVASVRLKNYKTSALVITIGITAALWASYSRSALGAFIVTIGVIVAATVARRLPPRWWIGIVVLVFALVGGLVAGRSSEFVSNVLLHENPTGGSAISSNDGHATSLVDGFTRMVQQPLGGGVGSTGSASLLGDEPLIIENHYLFVAHETGWLGIILFIIVFGIVLHRLWKQRADYLALGLFASGIGLALIGLLQPVWVDDTVAIIWWGLAAVALGGDYGKKRTRD